MTASDSPLARLRADYAARQKAAPARYVEIWEDGRLVAKLARAADIGSAAAVMRTTAILIRGGSEALTVGEDDLADVIAMCTDELFAEEDGERVPLGGPGAPMRFDAAFGAAIGVPGVTTARGAVFAAFSSPTVDGGPAELDALSLLAVGTAISMTLSGMTDETVAAAEAAVGEASALRS